MGDGHRPRTRVFAVANQKGGVGKTTTTVNLGACLAESGLTGPEDPGRRVLVVDLDPQANATSGLDLNPRALERSIYDVLMSELALDEVIEPTEVPGLHVVPADSRLADASVQLVAEMNRDNRLRFALAPVLDHYDVVLIDCPPSLGILTLNAMTAANEVLVPVQTEYYALEGLAQLTETIDRVRRSGLNPSLHITTVVLVMFDARTNLSGQVADEVRGHFGDIVCRQVIPRTVRLSEAPSHGKPITLYDPESRGAIAYRQLAKEVIDGPS